MKKITTVVTMLILTLLVFVGCSTTEAENAFDVIQKIVEVPNTNKDTLFLRASSWAVDAFISSDSVIELEDKEAGIIKGKCYLTTSQYLATIALENIITIEVKDNRARITIEPGEAYGVKEGGKAYLVDSTVESFKKEFENLLISFETEMKTVTEEW